MSILISVICPIYKAEPYLRQCVDSIINQSYKDLEIILVDDGSPDQCGLICDEYAKKDERVVVIHQENAGQSVARNRALDIAKGKVVAFVDSDDWLELDAFDILMNFMIFNDLDAVFMGCNIVKNGIITHKRATPFVDKTVTNAQQILLMTLKDEIGGQPWARICRRTLWEDVRFPEGRIYEDLAISYQPFIRAKRRIGFLNAPLYNYRMNPSGTSLSFLPFANYHIYLGFKEHYQYAIHNVPEAVDVCLAKTAMTAMGAFHASLSSSWDTMVQDITDVRSFLQEHKKEIKALESLSSKYKIRFVFYYASERTYALFARIAYRVIKLLK